jgi:hypothetical protein
MPIIRVVTTSLLFNLFRRSFGTHIKTKTNRDAPWVRLRTILLNAPMSVRYIVVNGRPIITNFDFNNVVPEQLSIRLGPQFKMLDLDRLTRVQLPKSPIKFVELFDRAQLGRDKNNLMLVNSIDLAMSLIGIPGLVELYVNNPLHIDLIMKKFSKMFGEFDDDDYDEYDVINPDWIAEEEDDDF